MPTWTGRKTGSSPNATIPSPPIPSDDPDATPSGDPLGAPPADPSPTPGPRDAPDRARASRGPRGGLPADRALRHDGPRLHPPLGAAAGERPPLSREPVWASLRGDHREF